MSINNPFDDPQGQFYILQNARGQFSLWPQQYPLPAGWQPVCEAQSVQACHDWLATHWSTLTPTHYAK